MIINLLLFHCFLYYIAYIPEPKLQASKPNVLSRMVWLHKVKIFNSKSITIFKYSAEGNIFEEANKSDE